MNNHMLDNLSEDWVDLDKATALAQERAAMLKLCDEKRRLDRESRQVMAELTKPGGGRWNGRGGVG